MSSPVRRREKPSKVRAGAHLYDLGQGRAGRIKGRQWASRVYPQGAAGLQWSLVTPMGSLYLKDNASVSDLPPGFGHLS